MSFYSATFMHGDKKVMVAGPTLNGVRQKVKQTASMLGINPENIPDLRWFGNTSYRDRGEQCDVVFINEAAKLKDVEQLAGLAKDGAVFKFQQGERA